MYLKRYHDLQVSRSGVWRILKRLEMNRLPSSQRYRRHVDRWKRYEKPQPGHRVQVDVKFIAPLKGSPPSGGLTLHIDQPPSRGVDGGQEVIPLVQEKACPGDTDQAGYRFSFRGKERTESSWTTVAICDDGSRHTVLVVWDSKNADSN
jgi:hypothetical protein